MSTPGCVETWIRVGSHTAILQAGFPDFACHEGRFCDFFYASELCFGDKLII